MKKIILFKGKFFKKDVTCKYNEVSSRKKDSVIEKKAKQIWQQKIREAKKSGKKVWDQPVYRLEKFHFNQNECVLEFSTIPFSIRISIKDFTNNLIEKGEEYLPMAVYSSIFVKTANGKFVFGEKSDKYLASRKYSYIGGVFNRSEKNHDRVELFADSRREVKEELGINDNDIKEFSLLGALRTKSCNAALVFYCRLKLTKNEVIEKFNERNELELKNLFFARREDLKEVGVNKIGKEPELVDIFEQSINE